MRKYSLGIVISIFAILVLVGTVVYSLLEGWSIIDAMYFTVTTITTIGFGDLAPTTDVTKLFTIIFAIISVPLVFLVFGIIIENYFETRVKVLEERLNQIMKEEKEIEQEIEGKNSTVQ